jgi:Sec7-like guanine-nucleotide exchange factor
LGRFFFDIFFLFQAQFKKTLKGTNGNKDFPDDMLSRIYYSVSTTEIKIYEDYFDGPVTALRWRVTNQKKRKENVFCKNLCSFFQGLQKRSKRFAHFALSTQGVCDREIFSLMWGKIVAAVGVVFSNA